MRARVDSAFGHLDPAGATADECWLDYERKLERWRTRTGAAELLQERWTALDAELDAILTPASRLVGALRAAGAPLRMSELGVDAARLRWALANCHLMRDRFTVADLAFFMGIFNDDGIDELLDSAALLGAGA